MRGLVGLCLAYWTRWTIFWLKRLDLYLNRFCRDGILSREISNSNVQPKDFKPFVLLLTSEVHGSSPKGFSVDWLSSGREGYFILYRVFLHTLNTVFNIRGNGSNFIEKSNAGIEIFGKTLMKKDVDLRPTHHQQAQVDWQMGGSQRFQFCHFTVFSVKLSFLIHDF